MQNLLKGLEILLVVILLLLFSLARFFAAALRSLGCLHLLAESIDPSLAVNKFHFTSEERVTLAADVNLDVTLSRTGLESVPTGTSYSSLWVPGWMDVAFHRGVIITHCCRIESRV